LHSGCALLLDEERVQVRQHRIDVEPVGGASLFEAFRLGTHAADAAEVVFLQHLHNIRVHPHNLGEGHIFGNLFTHALSL
jgi:hypothetical protein